MGIKLSVFTGTFYLSLCIPVWIKKIKYPVLVATEHVIQSNSRNKTRSQYVHDDKV